MLARSAYLRLTALIFARRYKFVSLMAFLASIGIHGHKSILIVGLRVRLLSPRVRSWTSWHKYLCHHVQCGPLSHSQPHQWAYDTCFHVSPLHGSSVVLPDTDRVDLPIVRNVPTEY